jgi:hypothetical protein
MANDRVRRAEQSLTAEGAIGCFSSSLILSADADRAPQLKASVRCLALNYRL